MSGQISEIPVLTKLSEQLSKPVAAEDLRRARWHLLDWLGCAVAGSREPAGIALRARSSVTPLDEAFAWGGLGNILEMDDVDKRALLHPGPSIVPAAIAVAAERDVEMVELLSAIVRGYDATIRLGRAVGAGHYALWHSTGTCGGIGATVAAASILGLSTRQTAHAMALAISQSAGLWHTRHDSQSMGKQLHTAVAARAGVDAAQMASFGFTGPLRILEGEQGFFAAMCPDGDAQAILRESANGWCIHDVSFKPWPACRHAHAAIDAAIALRDDIDLDIDDSIRVSTYADALKFCDRPDPQTVIEAKFSLQHSVAVSVLRGKPRLEDFSIEAVQDPQVRALRARVEVEEGPEFEDRYPARFGAEVAFGGRSCVANDALGDPENPVSVDQICAKAESLLMAGGVTDVQARDVISFVQTSNANTRILADFLREVMA
ncbi:MAG: MmgE/PrpD family protein [Pseudomonadota bacterium]